MEPRSEAERLARFFDAFEMPSSVRSKAYTDRHYLPCPNCRMNGGDRSGNNLWLQYMASEGRVAIACQKKCSQEDILSAVGLTWRDAVIVPEKPDAFFREADKQQRPQAPRKKAPVKAKDSEYRPCKWTDEYIYRNANGEDVFHVHRIVYTDAEGGKTFRQSVADPDKPNGRANHGPEADKKILYKLPELNASPRDKVVYLVEGEKDVETMMRLGNVATTMAGGANGPVKDKNTSDEEFARKVQEWSKKSAQERVGKKWLPQYTDELAGRDVVILPDNDVVGEKYMEAVAEIISLKAKRVRIVYLKQGYTQLQKKGDISDLCKVIGDEDAMGILRELELQAAEYEPPLVIRQAKEIVSKPEPQPQVMPDDGESDWVELREWDMEVEQDRYDRLRWLLINKVKKYTVKNGALCKWGKDAVTELCGFVCYARKMIMVHDGFSKTPQVQYVIEGWTAGGVHLPELTMPVEKFLKMDWPYTDWPMMVTMSSVSTTKSAMVEAFNTVSIWMHEKDERFKYIGWEKVGGQWCYLTNGSAIGAEGVDSEIVSESPAMSKYGLESDATDFDSMDASECFLSTMWMMEGIDKHISIPGIAMVFLAPLKEFLTQVNARPQMLMWFNGGYSSGKSVMAQLLLSYFGDFGEQGAAAPSTFKDTTANIRTKAAMVKDAIFLIDDFKPAQNRKEAQQMSDRADYIARMAFDGVTRGTNLSATTEGAATPARAMYLVTGEQYPESASSALSRMYIVNFRPNEVIADIKKPEGRKKMELVQRLQDAAVMGWNRKTMRGYIEWLLPQIPFLLKDLGPRYRRYQQEAAKRMRGGNQVRAANMVAHLMIGYDFYIRYMMHVNGVEMTMDDIEAVKEERDAAWEALIGNCIESMEDRKDMEPHEVYTQTLAALIESGAANVIDFTLPEEKQSEVKPVNMIGYKFADCYALIPKSAWQAVNQSAERSGVTLGLNMEAMKKKLIENNMMKYIQLHRAKLNGNARYWVFPRNVIDNGIRPETVEQMKIDMGTFTPANDEPLPFN